MDFAALKFVVKFSCVPRVTRLSLHASIVGPFLFEKPMIYSSDGGGEMLPSQRFQLKLTYIFTSDIHIIPNDFAAQA